MQKVRQFAYSTMAVVALMAALAGTGAVQAQSLPRSQEEFEKQLGITADQKSKVKSINDKYHPLAAAIQNKYKPKFDAIQKQYIALQQAQDAEMKPLVEKANKEIDAVFTPAQKAKMKQFQAMAAQQQQQGGGMGMGMPAGAPAAHK